jgi:hypothetical protein
MEQRIPSKQICLGPIKFLPIMAIAVLGASLFILDTSSYPMQNEDNSTLFPVFGVFSLLVFWLIRTGIEPARKDIRKIFPILVYTEIPAILGFTLSFIQMNNFYFYVFAFISLVYYTYVYKKLFSSG